MTVYMTDKYLYFVAIVVLPLKTFPFLQKMDDDTPWIPACLLGKSVDEAKAHVCGYVESKEDLDIVLEAHKRASLSSFVTW